MKILSAFKVEGGNASVTFSEMSDEELGNTVKLALLKKLEVSDGNGKPIKDYNSWVVQAGEAKSRVVVFGNRNEISTFLQDAQFSNLSELSGHIDELTRG